MQNQQPNFSPRSPTQQNDRNASRTRSPRGKSPSGRMARLPCKDDRTGTCTNRFREKWHPPECLFYKSEKVTNFGQTKFGQHHRLVLKVGWGVGSGGRSSGSGPRRGRAQKRRNRTQKDEPWRVGPNCGAPQVGFPQVGTSGGGPGRGRLRPISTSANSISAIQLW